MFRVVSESCQINFVRCYANCPDPGDVLILIIEATLRYTAWATAPPISKFAFSPSNSRSTLLYLGFRPSPLQSIYSPSSRGAHDMFNVECNSKDNPFARSLLFGVSKLCSRELSDWKHQRVLYMQNTTHWYIIYIRDSATFEVYGL